MANIAIAVLTIALLMGCGEEPDGLVLDDNETLGLLGSLRTPENAPSAPMNVAIGTPRVISVGYYSDWKLTKEIQSAEAGETVFIKIVFSEPMEHIVTGEGSGRPVLWYKERGSPMERFKVTSPKEKLIHGYAKPLGSGTDDYICRYVMPDKAVSIMVGKLSADLDGNTLTKFYHHPKKLQVTQSDTIGLPGLVEEPITHGYYNGTVASDWLPQSAWVLDFPGPYREYAPPESNPEDFVGRVCMKVPDASNDEWVGGDYIAPVQNALVTITHGPRKEEQVTTDEGGYFHFPNVKGDKMYLRVQRAYLEPKEVIAYRSRPTELQQLRPNEVFDAEYQNREQPQNAPGMILVGLRWPDAVRSILESEPLPHDLFLVIGPAFVDHGEGMTFGTYGSHEVGVYYAFPEEEGEIYHPVLIHELAHARQHAVAIMHGDNSLFDWEKTPEGKEYQAAWEKDLAEIPHKHWIGTLDKSEHTESDMLENAAEFHVYYWDVEREGNLGVHEATRDGGIRARAPNRYKWCQKYLKVKYN